MALGRGLFVLGLFLLVTQATSPAETQAPPAQEAPSPEFADDSPLIPQDETEDAGEGTEPSAEGGAESQDDGAATPEAETEAKPDAEEVEAEKPRTYSEEEWRARESAKDREIAAERKAREEVAAQVQQLRQQFEQEKSSQTFQAEVQAFENKLTAQFVQAGFDEQTARTQAQEQTRIGVVAWQKEQENLRLQQQIAEMRRLTETTNARETARRFADQYGVPTEKMSLLMASTPENMEVLAKELGTLYKRTKEQAAKREAEVPADGPEQKFDTGGGQRAISDDQILNTYDASIPAQRKEIERVLRSRGQHPLS